MHVLWRLALPFGALHAIVLMHPGMMSMCHVAIFMAFLCACIVVVLRLASEKAEMVVCANLEIAYLKREIVRSHACMTQQAKPSSPIFDSSCVLTHFKRIANNNKKYEMEQDEEVFSL